MDRRTNPIRQTLPDLPDETLFNDPLTPSSSTAPVEGFRAGVGGPSTLTGEQAFRDSLAGGRDLASDRAPGRASGSDATTPEDSGSSMPDPGEAVAAVKSGGGRARGWIEEHPLTAVGLGLIAGIVLGARGGGEQHHHHHHGPQESHDGGQQGQSDHQQGGQSHHQGQQGRAGGLLGLVQQAGLMDSVTSITDRAVRVVNDQASDMLRQRVPGFDEQLGQKRASHPSSESPEPEPASGQAQPPR